MSTDGTKPDELGAPPETPTSADEPVDWSFDGPAARPSKDDDEERA